MTFEAGNYLELGHIRGKDFRQSMKDACIQASACIEEGIRVRKHVSDPAQPVKFLRNYRNYEIVKVLIRFA